MLMISKKKLNCVPPRAQFCWISNGNVFGFYRKTTGKALMVWDAETKDWVHSAFTLSDLNDGKTFFGIHEE